MSSVNQLISLCQSFGLMTRTKRDPDTERYEVEVYALDAVFHFDSDGRFDRIVKLPREPRRL